MNAVPDEEMYEFSCEELGTCDDSCSPPARDDCLVTEETETPTPVGRLPETGITDPTLLLAAGMAAVIAGARLLRGAR